MSNTTPTKKQGIMICGHGSRDKDAEREFGLVAKGLKDRYPDLPVEYGFLEFSAPNIHMGLDSLIRQGVEEIFAVPGMLFAATPCEKRHSIGFDHLRRKTPRVKSNLWS